MFLLNYLIPNNLFEYPFLKCLPSTYELSEEKGALQAFSQNSVYRIKLITSHQTFICEILKWVNSDDFTTGPFVNLMSYHQLRHPLIECKQKSLNNSNISLNEYLIHINLSFVIMIRTFGRIYSVKRKFGKSCRIQNIHQKCYCEQQTDIQNRKVQPFMLKIVFVTAC